MGEYMKSKSTPMTSPMTPIAAAVAFLLMGASMAAQAQQAAPATPARADAETTTQEIVVTGIRGALQQSLNQKRNAESHVDVITAEDIGKMPDKNVADSLQRVPGVTISSAGANEGGFDENDRVSMRGTNPSLTQTLINGHNVASGDWFILNQTGTVGRSVSYTLMPSELVGKVVVHKTSEASLIEGGVAGSVDIVTRKPLDFKKALTAEGAVGLVYAEQPKKTDPQLSGLINWKNEAGTMGILVQAFSETRHLRRDGQELLGYEKIAPGSKVALSNPDLAGVYYPGLIGSALFEQERKRTGGLIDVQIKPSKELTLDFTGFMSTMKAQNYNRNYLLWPSKFLNQGGILQPGQTPDQATAQAPDPGYQVKNNTLVGANFTPVAGTQYGVYDQISRPDASADSNFFNFDAKYRPNEFWTFSTKTGTSRGTGNTPTQNVAEWNIGTGTGGGYGLHGIGSAADWNLGTANNASPAGVPLGWIFGDQNVHVKDKENWAQLDSQYAAGAGMLSAVRFGVRWSEHERGSQGVIGQGPYCNGVPLNWAGQFNCTDPSKSPFNPANFPSGYSNYPSNFGSGLGGAFPTNPWQYSPDQLADFNTRYANRDPVTRQDWSSEFSLKERNTAGYVQANLEGQGWSGNIGLRLVQTKEHVLTNVAVDPATPGAITTSAFGAYLPTATDHSYNDVLPSANLRFDLRADLVGRVALTRTMTRPDYSALAGSVSLSPPAVAGGTGSGSGGNPDLKPIRSTNFDTSLEWYFAPRSLASVGLFYMDMQNYVGLGQVSKSFMTFSNANPQGALVPYTLSVPINTSAKAKGIELAYEMPLFGNYGFATNYTYVDAKDADDKPVVGASRNTYNLSGYFENDMFNARLTYNYRSAFYSGLDRSTAFSQAEVASVSASLGYKISDNLTLSLDLQNLNNPKLKYYALSEDQPRSVYQSGRQYYLTLRGKM